MHYAKTTKSRRNDPWQMVGDFAWRRDFAAASGIITQMDDDHFAWSVTTNGGKQEMRIAPSLTLAKAAVLQSAKKRKLTTKEKK